MGRISYLFKKVAPAMIEGKFFHEFHYYLQTYVYSIPDRATGAVARSIFNKSLKVENNKIIFTTFQQDYTCNPKYITEELLKRDGNYKIVWALSEKSMADAHDIPSSIKLVQRGTVDFYREWFTSKVQVVNSVDVYQKFMPKPKKEQVLFQTWHGSLGIKRFGKDPAWTLRKAAKRMTEHTDFVISNSTFEDDVYKDTLWHENQIITLGHARNDVLIETEKNKEVRQEIIAKVKKSLHVDENTKLFLYAPTFRNGIHLDVYDVDVERVVNALTEKFGGNWVFLVRLHPTARDRARELPLVSEVMDRKIDVTSYPDIQELTLASNIFMTDYSSGIYDFVVSKQPGFLYCKDIEKYNTERGFYYPLETTPFPIARNNDELINQILNFDIKTYQSKVDDFLIEKGCIDDGYSSERIVDKILGYLSE